ncbi:MAG: hypothetical protein WB709_13255, partial [Solirubrobacteraceae bacterium]
SGPAMPRATPAPARRTAPSRNPATVITTHPLFDRLIHGRAWIGLVTFALIGIVTMQLGLLKLNAGIGRALEHEGALQRENSALSVENSEVAAGDTVELQAAHMGMQLVPAGSLKFLSAQGSQSEIGKALAALSARASATTATSSEASSSSEAEASSSTSATGESEANSSTGTSGGEETSPNTASSETSQSSTSASSEAPASSEHASSGAESGASEATSTPASSSESGGASATPGG